jgi:hypothetical protein
MLLPLELLNITTGICIVLCETLQYICNCGHMLITKIKNDKYLKPDNCLQPKAKPLVCETAVLSPEATVSDCWLLESAFMGFLYLATSTCYS